jgi:tetratricopeptide (TPR) repeat protein
VQAVDALGFALEALGDDAGALENYKKAVALNEAQQGRFASAHVNLSAYYNRAGDPETALAYARAALELDPKSDRAWFQKAKGDEQQGRLAEAALSLNHAIALNSRAASYHYVLAGLYRRLGRAEESRAALDAFRRLEREASELEKTRRRNYRANAAAAGPEG